MAQQRADENRMTQDFMIDQELARVRQAAPVRVRYANEF
jgi:hypothetical protein